MNRIILCIILFLSVCHIQTFGQVIDSESYHNNLEAAIGIQGTPNSREGVDMRLDLSYGYFFYNGIGFRTGLTYTPEMLGFGQAIGAPISFAWRTYRLDRSYSPGTIDYDEYNPDYMLHQDYAGYVKEQVASGLLRLLTRIASNIEVDAGVTPGYLWGKRADSFYMTGDLGLRTSWRISRFNLTINPAMHYILTDKVNMGDFNLSINSWDKWQLSLVFGVSVLL